MNISSHKNQIAIIGMSCKFPGANNIYQFWDMLKNGRETISHLSIEQVKATGVHQDLLNYPNYIRYRGVLDDVELFNPELFRFSAADLDLLSIQAKNLLMATWQALENAGISPKGCPKRTSVFTGSNNNPYSEYTYSEMANIVGVKKRFYTKSLASLVSYQFGLQGTSFNLYTACSTSLVAVIQACQDLSLRRSDVAIAGAVSIDMPQALGYLYDEESIFSVDGHCRAFDAKATGTVFSNGVAVVILKRLEDAIQDKNKIYAVILGHAINNDGNLKTGIFAPGVSGQYSCILEACKNAGVDPGMMDYIEAHGSATLLGDSIECFALKKVLQESNMQPKPCGIGSVKTNIGHTTVASGMAALIKSALMLDKRALVPSLHFEELNPNINIEDRQLYIATKYESFPKNQENIFCGVSNFGLGGTNTHAILRNYYC